MSTVLVRQRCRQLRATGMTVWELARRLGVEPKTVDYWLSDASRCVDCATDLLAVSPDGRCGFCQREIAA